MPAFTVPGIWLRADRRIYDVKYSIQSGEIAERPLIICVMRAARVLRPSRNLIARHCKLKPQLALKALPEHRAPLFVLTHNRHNFIFSAVQKEPSCKSKKRIQPNTRTLNR
jgi:hypothetical protein